MCDMPDNMMEDMKKCQDQIEMLQAKLDAVAKYLKMDFKWNPETYEMVKPTEMSTVPMQVR